MIPERNIGFGECKMEAIATVIAPLSWITEGREHQYAATVLAAVHDYNRKAAVDNFIALDFPNATFKGDFAGKPGVQARLIGSREALAKVLGSDRLIQFHRPSVARNGTAGIQSLISPFKPLVDGYCLMRSQKSSRIQPGAIRRKIARAKRRNNSADHIAALVRKLAESEAMTAEQRRIAHNAPREAAIFLGDKPFFFTRKKVASSVSSGRVSTYGMSSDSAPVVFGECNYSNWPSSKTNTDSISDIMSGIIDEGDV